MSGSNIWLKMSDIEGDSTDFGHEGEIDVMSWRWRLSKGSRNAVGKATTVHHLSIAHPVGAMSTSLISHMTMNRVAGEAVLSWRDPTAQAIPAGLGKVTPPKDSVKIIMKNVMIMDIEPFGYQMGHFEEVLLSFDVVKIESIKLRAGIPAGTVTAQYVCRPESF
ncbi:Hcp1 family type VI secretion system effector [Caballeronia pedi]|uniref:Hcp1 family type VI secretion system effector n=1 Tax=Caballeronia pedi TaxID=1777141 RepID=A0A158B496_9BURK|nr:type VI secretion system tube protein Hcp [Caballeronia pedi]SAK64843.1 Hcp1 family type VI secretion system effector [Caballeronia pedi]